MREMAHWETEEEKGSPQRIPIMGRFDQYRSSYWAASVAVLPLRYLIRPFIRKSWDNPEISHFDRHKYSGFAGSFMYGVTAYYAERTWKDMKHILGETLAWEFNKQEKDVTFSDFLDSKNTIVKQTADNYLQYNARRFGVNTVFFLPFLAKSLFKKYNLHPETGVDLGVAANAAYLFSDVVSRRMTPFEELQELIDTKINQSRHYGDKITGSDLLDIYERHAENGVIHSFMPQRGTPEWERSMQLFDRMAELMNETYRNVVPKEKTDFGFSMFIHLVGNGLIDPAHVNRSAAYIEIAAKYGIKGLRGAEEDVKQGATVAKLYEKYPVAKEAQPPRQEMPVLVHAKEIRPSMAVERQAPLPSA